PSSPLFPYTTLFRSLLRRHPRRLPARVPAHLLVLLAPGGLHHDAARLRDRLRGDLRDGAEADLRLPVDGAVARRDPRARLLRLRSEEHTSELQSPDH